MLQMALRVQSAQSQSLFFPHVKSSPANQEEEQGCLHPRGGNTLEKQSKRRVELVTTEPVIKKQSEVQKSTI